MDKKAILEIAAMYCDRCGNRYEESSLEIIKEMPGGILVLLVCSRCKATHMVSVATNRGVGSRVMINTDLSLNEIKTSQIGKAISSNELIDLHSALQSGLNKIHDIATVTNVKVPEIIFVSSKRSPASRSRVNSNKSPVKLASTRKKKSQA